MIRRVAVLLLTTQVSLALADQRIQLPDGGGCWQNSSGHVYGCSGGGSGGGESAADVRDRRTARAIREAEASRQAALKKCLRTADWPNQPSKDDCMAMHGSAQ